MDTLGMGRFFNYTKIPGKMMLSLQLLALSVILALIFRSSDRTLCVFAMAFSSLGDFMLVDELEPVRNRLKIKKAFLLGGATFILAHIFYILTFFRLLSASGAPLSTFNAGSCLALGIAAALIVLFTVICAKRKDFSKFPLLLVYVVMLTADCYAAFTYGFAEFGARKIALLAPIGAFSFMLSDLILGLDMIGGIKKFNPWLWWFYPIGQLLMIISA